MITYDAHRVFAYVMYDNMKFEFSERILDFVFMILFGGTEPRSGGPDRGFLCACTISVLTTDIVHLSYERRPEFLLEIDRGFSRARRYRRRNRRLMACI